MVAVVGIFYTRCIQHRIPIFDEGELCGGILLQAVPLLSAFGAVFDYDHMRQFDAIIRCEKVIARQGSREI